MNRIVTTVVAGLAFAAMAAAPTMADEDDNVIVLDAPDIQKLRTDVQGFRVTDVVGTEVYSNGGKRIGELDDFVVTHGGYLYAVVDTSDGEINDILTVGNDELVVVPWDQLRTAPKAEVSALRQR